MVNEKRKHDRHPHCEPLYYSRYVSDWDYVAKWTQETLSRSSDESPSGICIHTNRPFAAGARLRLNSPAWGSQKEVTVRWCKSLGVGRFKAGLSVLK